MKKLLLFAGTTEGRQLAQGLAGLDVEVLASVATDYGKSLLPPVENLRVRVGRLNRHEIAALLDREEIDCAVDATHPYAAEATGNLTAACVEKKIPCYRLTREISDMAGCIPVASMEEGAAYLSRREGNALLTVGSKELEWFTRAAGWRERFYVRVLPLAASLEKCAALGFPGSHIIAMQGPFSAAFNAALLRETHSRWLVTKDSGAAGGFPEKCQGAGQAGAQVIVVGRTSEAGYSLPEMLEFLQNRYGGSAL